MWGFQPVQPPSTPKQQRNSPAAAPLGGPAGVGVAFGGLAPQAPQAQQGQQGQQKPNFGFAPAPAQAAAAPPQPAFAFGAPQQGAAAAAGGGGGGFGFGLGAGIGGGINAGAAAAKNTSQKISIDMQLKDLPEAYRNALEKTKKTYILPMQDGLADIKNATGDVHHELKNEIRKIKALVSQLANRQQQLMQRVTVLEGETLKSYRDCRKNGTNEMTKLKSGGGGGERKIDF